MEEKSDLFEEINTSRLILKKVTDLDAKDLYENIYNNFEWFKYYYQLEFKDYLDYATLVSKYKGWYANGNHFRWGIYLKSENKIIGLVQIHSKDNLNSKCKLGYIIGYNYCHKGYTKEALIKVIDFAFNKLSYHKIEAEIVSDNKSSIELVKSLGMKYECTKKEDYKLKDKYYDQVVYYLVNSKKG